MPRAHHFTRKQRREMEARAGGCCEKCHAVLKPGEGDADHVLPVELGGESEAYNGQWLCRPCHKGKTALDIRMIRKADRMRDKANNTFPKPVGNRRLQSRNSFQSGRNRQYEEVSR